MACKLMFEIMDTPPQMTFLNDNIDKFMILDNYITEFNKYFPPYGSNIMLEYLSKYKFNHDDIIYHAELCISVIYLLFEMIDNKCVKMCTKLNVKTMSYLCFDFIRKLKLSLIYYDIDLILFNGLIANSTLQIIFNYHNFYHCVMKKSPFYRFNILPSDILQILDEYLQK